MSFLNEINSEHLAARITNKGRKKIAQGDFNIHYFQLGDSEFDYAFSEFDGTSTRPAQKVFTPLDKDNQVKYPYKISESSLTGTTFGNPIQVSQTETIRNVMGPAGYVSNYIEYDSELCEGTTVECGWEQIDISKVNGTSSLVVPSGTTFNNCKFITIFFDVLYSSSDIIQDDATSLVYRVVNLITGTTSGTTNTMILDRPMPNYSSLSQNVTVICNECTPQYPGPHDEAKVCLPIPPTPEDQQDPWTQNTVWSKKPAGMDYGSDMYGLVEDERLSGYTSNVFVSTKEFFGYNTSSGQTSNSGTTITNSFGDTVIILPEEQKCISILHYSKVGDILRDPELGFKYEDYISTNNVGDDALIEDSFGDPLTDLEYFEIYIPFIYYHRTAGTTVGARFFMGTTDMSINSTAIDTKLDQMKYRYLIDEHGNKVGKVFYNHKVIIFDDEEIVAALDYKSNRRYTLPAPRIAMVPTDTKCGEDGEPLTPLMTGTTGQTIFVTYILEYTGDTQLNGLHCNYYTKLTGTTTPGDVSIKFGENEFRHMKTTLLGSIKGFIANKFEILVQKVNTGSQPDPTMWKIIDFTPEIPGHSVGTIINPVNLRNKRFVITNADYENAGRYDLETYLQPNIDFPNEHPGNTHLLTTPEFGDEQPFTGSIRLVRAIDLEVMRFLINLPSGEFTTTQNPSFITGKQKRITEVALLNENKEVLVIAKVPKPIVRTGTQVFAVKIDI
jgi:hypothetical protein